MRKITINVPIQQWLASMGTIARDLRDVIELRINPNVLPVVDVSHLSAFAHFPRRAEFVTANTPAGLGVASGLAYFAGGNGARILMANSGSGAGAGAPSSQRWGIDSRSRWDQFVVNWGDAGVLTRVALYGADFGIRGELHAFQATGLGDGTRARQDEPQHFHHPIYIAPGHVFWTALTGSDVQALSALLIEEFPVREANRP